MKSLLFCVFLGLILASRFEAKSFQNEQNTDKRFLGSIGSWINNNIINPITDNVINPITGGVTSVINTIVDPLVSFGNQLQNVVNSVDNFFSQTLVGAVNTAIDTIKDQTLNVVNMAANVIFPSGNGQSTVPDPCQTTCFQRVNYQDQNTDYYFDRDNGCISKGYIDSNLKIFDSCCDAHNRCLNSRCCTTECQNLKNECDTEYNNCLKKSCVQFIVDDTKFYTCLARGSFIASAAVNKTCNPQLTQNRKICYC